jgi:hypothetical protein
VEEIEAAARSANAHDFISEFPNKYETEIGDRGKRNFHENSPKFQERNYPEDKNKELQLRERL